MAKRPATGAKAADARSRLSTERKAVTTAYARMARENRELQAVIAEAAQLYLRIRSAETEYHAPWNDFDAWLKQPAVVAALQKKSQK